MKYLMRHATPVIGAVLCLALLAGCTMTIDPNFQAPQNSPQIEPGAAEWQTWVLASSDELRPGPPPDAAASAAEIAQLKEMMMPGDAEAQAQITYWDAGSPSYRWIELGLNQYRGGPPGPPVSRALALLNVALYDAIIATWEAKYEYNRPHPSQVDARLETLIPVPNSPSYPSEHAAAAGAASTVLAYLFPDQADFFTAMAEEAARSRLLAGVHYPSDVETGLALGRAVGEKVVEWAMSDSSDAVWDGVMPDGPGNWKGENPVAPMSGTWRTWVLEKGDQFLPPPPPAYDSEQIQAELAEIKSITRTFPIMAAAFYQHTFESAYPDWYDWVSRRLFEQRLDLNPPQAARIYTALAVTVHDAIVACFNAKYAYWFIRPSQLDPEVVTLFPPPPHPSYPAGHGCASGATGGILGALFPSDAEALKQTTEAAATTRIWAGIHYRVDIEAGLELGASVAEVVMERVRQMTQL